MGNKKKHLSKKERVKIENWLDVGLSQKEIAHHLGRSTSCISKEIGRGTVKGIYDAKKAHQKAYIRQYRKKRDCMRVERNPHIRKFVEQRIRWGWSPEMIASRLKVQSGVGYASPKAIRKFIGKRRPSLEIYLFWYRNRKKGGRKRKTTFLTDGRKNIKERGDTSSYGHWEMDFIVSSHNSSVLLVLVEKKTRYTKIQLLPNRNNNLVTQAVFSLLCTEDVSSITTDNDIAFQNWREMEKQLDCNVYFTDPYCSWQKGLVENMNRWIRQFVPKKTDLTSLNEAYVLSVERWLNSVARPILGGYTAYERYVYETGAVSVTSLLSPLPGRVDCSGVGVSIWG